MEKKRNAGVYRISDINTLIEIISLINGKFRTPKIEYLHKAIDRINLIYNLNIEKLPLDTSDLGSNFWLAGFTDADGNFHISLEGVYGLNSSISRGRVKCTFSIVQRVIDKSTGLSCIPFMTEIANLFQCKIKHNINNRMIFMLELIVNIT